MTIRFSRNSTSTGPTLSRLKWYRMAARAAAGTTPSAARIAAMQVSPASISHGRMGLMNTCPRLRLHTSSMNVTAKPRWLRNAVSHSSTPPSSMPTVTAGALPSLAAKKWLVNPQMTICMMGQ